MSKIATDSQKSSEEIAEEIRQTRQHLDETLDALGGRFHPSSLLDEAVERWERIDKNQIAEAAHETAVTAKEHLYNHPLSSFVIAAGVGLLAYEKTRPAGKAVTAGEISQQSKETWNNTVEGAHRARQSAQQAVSQATQSAKEGVYHAREGIRRNASQAKGSLQRSVASLGNKASRHYHTAVEHTQTYATHKRAEAVEFSRESQVQVKTTLQRGCDQASRVARENSLAIGAGMMVLGVVAGLLAPRTRTEDRQFGRRSDVLKQRALARSQAMMEQGREVAQKTYQSAKKTAHEEGLTPGDLAESAEHVTEQAKQTAKKETQKAAHSQQAK